MPGTADPGTGFVRHGPKTTRYITTLACPSPVDVGQRQRPARDGVFFAGFGRKPRTRKC